MLFNHLCGDRNTQKQTVDRDEKGNEMRESNRKEERERDEKRRTRIPRERNTN